MSVINTLHSKYSYAKLENYPHPYVLLKHCEVLEENNGNRIRIWPENPRGATIIKDLKGRVDEEACVELIEKIEEGWRL